MNEGSGRDWSLVVAGIALVILGIVFLFSPTMTLVTIAVVAGIALVAVGLVDLVLYLRYRHERGISGWAVAYAVCDILLGAVLLIHPLVSAAVIPWLVGVCLIAYGVLEIVAAWRIRSTGLRIRVDMARSLGVGMATSTAEGWGWVLAGGIAAIVCGLLFFFVPAVFAVILSAFLIARGAMMAAYGVSDKSSVDAAAVPR